MAQAEADTKQPVKKVDASKPKWQEWYDKNSNLINKVEIRPKRTLSVFTSMNDKNKNNYAFFIHGACARMGQFENQIDCFINDLNFNVIAFDRIGCGMSDKPNNWDSYSDGEIFADLCSLFEKYIPKNNNNNKDNNESNNNNEQKNDDKTGNNDKNEEMKTSDKIDNKNDQNTNKNNDKNDKNDKNENISENSNLDEKKNGNENEKSNDNCNIFIIAHSYGTSQSIRLCDKYLNTGSPYKYNIKGVILMGMPAIGNQLPKDGSLSAASMIFYLPETVLGWIQPALSKGFRDAAIHENSNEKLKEMESSFSNHNAPYMFRAFYRQCKLCDSGTFERFKEYNVPICIFHGKDDKLTSIKNAKSFFNDFTKDNKNKTTVELSKFHEIRNTSHQVMQEDFGLVNGRIEQFVKSILNQKEAK